MEKILMKILHMMEHRNETVIHLNPSHGWDDKYNMWFFLYNSSAITHWHVLDLRILTSIEPDMPAMKEPAMKEPAMPAIKI